jgi:hypothetical protein
LSISSIIEGLLGFVSNFAVCQDDRKPPASDFVIVHAECGRCRFLSR